MKLALVLYSLAFLVAGDIREEELPVFEIDLALPPGHRFNETVHYFREQMDIVMPFFLKEFPPYFHELFQDYD